MKINTETYREVCHLVDKTSTTLSNGMKQIANAITTQNAMGGSDAAGGYVSCLTEAVMGLTKSMMEIADAINNVADAMNNEANRKIIAEHHKHEGGDCRRG